MAWPSYVIGQCYVKLSLRSIKGSFLLWFNVYILSLKGVKAVLAESFERIHRSNLVGMGIIPLEYKNGENAERLGLTGRERFTIELPSDLKPRQAVTVKVGKD